MSFITPGSFGGGFNPPGVLNPLGISGLLAWYDASDNSTLTLSGSELTQIQDKSGNGYHSTDDATKRPTIETRDGKQCIRFVSGDTINITGLVASAGNYTMFFAHRPSDNVSISRFLLDAATGRLVAAHTTGTAGGKLGYYDGAYKGESNATTAKQIVTYDLNSSGASVYRDGLVVGTGTYTQTAIGGGVAIGSANTRNNNFYVGDLYEVLIYTGTLSAANRLAVERYLSLKWNFPNLNAASNIIVCDGDSLTGCNQTATFSYPGALLELYGAPGYCVVNDGIPSAQLTTMDTAAATGIDTYTYPVKPTLVIWGGTNDIASNGQTAAQTYTRLRTYIQARVTSAKYRKIVVVTAIPRADTATTATLFDYNDQIRDNWTTLQSDGASAYVDTETDAAFNADGDYNDTTYYNADKVHLTTDGYAKIAALVKTTVDTL